MSPREQLDRKIADVRLRVILPGQRVDEQLRQALKALDTLDVNWRSRVEHYREIHPLVVSVLNQTIEHMAEMGKKKKVTATYGILQVAQHVDRVGDHTTNIAERVIYIATGSLSEMNIPVQNSRLTECCPVCTPHREGNAFSPAQPG
jgi:phosphate uptake regulator